MEKYKNKYRIASSRAQWWDYGTNAAYFITICTKNRQHSFGTITNDQMILSYAGLLADVFWNEIKRHGKNVELDAFQVMPNHIHGILILNGDQSVESGGIDGYDGMGGMGGSDGMVGSDGMDGYDGMGRSDGMGGIGGSVETRHALSLPSTLPPPPPPPPPSPSPPPPPSTLPPSPSTLPPSPSTSPSPPPPPQPSTLPPPPPPTQSMQPTAPKSIGQQRFQNQGKNTVSSIIGSYKSAVTKHANRLGLPFEWQQRFHDHIIRNDAEFFRISNYIENNVKNWKEDGFFKKD